MRKEKDSLGTMNLPDESYYGIQTERVKRNISVSGHSVEEYMRYVWHITAIKKAAAMANCHIGAIGKDVMDAIARSCDEIMSGELRGNFPVDVFHCSTSVNMNINEVIANRANELLTGEKGRGRVHPNTHVNMCQSTNDVMPSAIKMTCHAELKELSGVLSAFLQVLKGKIAEFADVVKSARTCLQDALPITLGQEFSGYASFIERQINKVEEVAEKNLRLPLGATAVGTGYGTLPGYIEVVYGFLEQVTGVRFVREKNFFDGLQNCDVHVEVSSVLKSIAAGLAKMAGDMRILSSGPRAGISELKLPALNPGSSIMPGKVNPVIPELIIKIYHQVCGNDLSVAMASGYGELDLNVWGSVISKNLFDSIKLIKNGTAVFGGKCISGIRVDEKRCREYAQGSLSLSTVISSVYGYEKGVEVSAAAMEQGISVKEAAVKMKLISAEEAESLFALKNLV